MACMKLWQRKKRKKILLPESRFLTILLQFRLEDNKLNKVLVCIY